MQHSFYSSESAFKSYQIPQKNQNEDIFHSIINLQFSVTNHLISGQNLLQLHFRKQRQTSDSSQSFGSNFIPEDKEPICESDQMFEQKDFRQGLEDKQILEMPRLRNRKKVQYSIFQDEDEQNTPCRSETKNIIKNYMKSFFNFIKGNKQFINYAFKITGNDSHSFVQFIKKETLSINSIIELKKLWVEGEFCQQLRILSNYYFRRKYTHHIFNSRVNHYKVHLKYRVRFLELMKNPSEISCLKSV